MATTYEKIATTTLGSAAATITFSSIPNTFTDLRLVVVMFTDTTNTTFLRLNNDSDTNYSETLLWGNGTAASSGAATGIPRIGIANDISGNSTFPHFAEIDLFSYAGSTNKTVLVSTAEDYNGSGIVRRGVALWRNTTAVNRLDLGRTAGNFTAGTTATIYGLLKA
jgi:hypothetical protein